MPDTSPAPDSRFARYLLLATLSFYMVVQLVWIQATPLQPIFLPDNLPEKHADAPLLVGLGPDEKEHFLYIRSITDNGRIPKPSPDYRTAPEQYVSYQAQHPPLFYAVAAVVYKAAHPLAGDIKIWYILRGLCVLCGMGVILLTDKAAKTAFPDRPLVALGTAPFMAFLPMFGHMTGNLSNEPLAMVFGAAVWLQSVRLIRRHEPPTLREAVILGATLALACLTRLTALIWLPVVVVALFRTQTAWKDRIASFTTFALLLAPWLAYNQVAYGKAFLRTFDRPLLDRGPLADFFGRGLVPAEFPVPINATQTLLWYAGTAWLPVWLMQFYQTVDVRPLLLLLDAVAIILIVLNVGKLTQGDVPDSAGKAIIGAGFATITFCLAALIQQQLFSDWNVVLSAGRYLVAAAPATGLLFVFALSTIKPLNRAWFAAVLALLMLGFGGYAAKTVEQFYIDRPKQAEVQPVVVSGQ
ncbi:MAG: hypothetical protein H8F28_08435 [Fibrella sp.]|nr:hypothetical protein [Armatimonadota bacterium]